MNSKSVNQFYQVATVAGNGTKDFQDGNALEAMFSRPTTICCSSDGKLYINEYFSNIIRLLHNDKVTIIAGNGERGYKDGNALEAMFNGPTGMFCCDDGKLYISDNKNHTIRMLYNNQVTTIAGNGKEGYKDGNALEAMFSYPEAICCSADGKLYICDRYNHVIRIVHNNQVTTLEGDARNMFSHPWEICSSPDGRLYVSDGYNHRIRMIHNDQITTIAGIGKEGFQDGNALEAMFNHPFGICCSTDGRIYVADLSNHAIRMIYNNQVTTIAGTSELGFKDGNALEAMFHSPSGICCSNDGKIYVADQFNHRIRMIYTPHKPPFGFALLLDMKNTFSDCQISFNNITHHLHSTLVNIRCPSLLDQSCLSLLQQSNISNKSFESFVNFLYSNTFTNQYNQTWKTIMSIKDIAELIFMFDLVMNCCKSILTDLKTTFTKQLIETLEINQQPMKEKILDLLPCIYNLKQIIKTRPVISSIATNIPSYIENCYNILIDELKKRRSIFEECMNEIQRNISDESYTSIMNDMLSETTQIDTIGEDETMIGADLAELAKLAFYKTNICNHECDKAIESSTISTQHLDKWTTPDFAIKLSNDDISYDVHKLIICGRWKYFCLMIESGLKEFSDNEMTLSDDWNRSRFEKMIKYIYLNEIDFEDLDDIEWLNENGKLYGIVCDKRRNENEIVNKEKSEVIDEEASYGFEDLYAHIIRVLGRDSS